MPILLASEVPAIAAFARSALQKNATSMDICFTSEIVRERVFAYRVNIDIAALKSQPSSGDRL